MYQNPEQEKLVEEALKLAVMVVEQTKAMEKLMRELRELIRRGEKDAH